jgi:serine protease inhibitor
VGSDIDRMRLPKIEVASHRRALGKALKRYRGEMAEERGAGGARSSDIGHRRGLRIAIPVASAIALGLVAVLVFSLAGSPTGGESGVTRLTESQALAARVETRTTGFDFALFSEVAGEDSGNVVLSPLSARIALAMAYNGASDEVSEEMAYVLDFAGMSLDEVNAMMRGIIDSLLEEDTNVQLEMASSIWSDDEIAFLEDFRARCVQNYDAEVASVDLDGPEAAGTIDAWVSEKTHGKIPEIAGSFDLKYIGAMLINALYLKGAWTYQFDPSLTAPGSFTLADGEVKRVPLMSQAGDYDYLENEDFQAVSLPYGDGRLSMYIFLPTEEKSLDGFVQGLNRDDWERWMAAFSIKEGMISLPRFELEYTKDLSTALTSLGMGSAFMGDAFPRMANVQPLWIDRVVQKTYMDVNEEGTEAAAATAVGMTWGGDFIFMEVNRPFFFAIRDNQTGTLLFMGSILEP